VTPRSVALVLALVVAVAPAISLMCDMDCVPPPAASTACHNASGPSDAIAVGATHTCDHDHRAGSPALLTGATGRDSVGASYAAALLTLEESLVPEAPVATAAAVHGPPGLNSPRTTSLTTVLRI
jgi:hypothetical protein